MVKETYLHDKHVALGAKMVDFAGWHMPVQYSSIIEEHKTVRNAVGLYVKKSDCLMFRTWEKFLYQVKMQQHF